MTAQDAFLVARNALTDVSIAEPDAKARVIVAHVLDGELSAAHSTVQITQAQSDMIQAMVQRCAAGEPVEYVTGRAYFRYVVLDVTPDVLIPRHETELVAEEAIGMIRRRGYKTALDMCTGSGCIAVSLAMETDAAVDACDISQKALLLARHNAAMNDANVRFENSDMFDSVSDTYDIIVCNPPYVSDADYAELDDSVRQYEPKGALVAGDGLNYYRIIAQEAAVYMRSGGVLVLEIGASQAADVTKLLADAGYTDVTYKKDYAGRDRIVTARKG